MEMIAQGNMNLQVTKNVILVTLRHSTLNNQAGRKTSERSIVDEGRRNKLIKRRTNLSKMFKEKIKVRLKITQLIDDIWRGKIGL